MENTSHIVPQWQRALIVSDDSIFEDFGPLRTNPIPMNPVIFPAAFERSLKHTDQVKQRYLDFGRWLSGRTRRLLKPIVRGNNQHGRMGKRRCLQCRTWKQKCEYVNVADPCKVCREKGLRCTASDKIWGNARRLRQAVEGDRTEIQVGDVELPKDDDSLEEIPRQPHTSDENMLRPVDGIWLQFYLANLHNDRFYLEEPNGVPGRRRFEPLGHNVFQRFGPTLASMAVRNAVILLSLRTHRYLLNQKNESLLEMEYKGRFYRALSKAINERAYTDILYASYFACLGGLFDIRWRGTNSSDDFTTNLGIFSSVLITVAPASTVTEIFSAYSLLVNVTEWTFRNCVGMSWVEDIFRPLRVAYIALESVVNRSVLQGYHASYGRYLQLMFDYICQKYAHAEHKIVHFIVGRLLDQVLQLSERY